MPNYCKEHLSITCSEDTFEQIKDYVKSEESVFDFDKIIPMPENIYRGFLGSKEESLYGKDNWYDWSLENWGTKWNACCASLDGHTFYFETAWSPCLPVIDALAKRFPEVTMRYTYTEYDFGFCGVVEYRGGNLTYQFIGDYNEYCFDEDCEESEVSIPTSIPTRIFKRFNANGINEKFIVVSRDGNKTSGKYYLYERCDVTWGREIIADVSYVGEQPDVWY